MNFTRQNGFIEQEEIAKYYITLIGAGATGSMSALALTKMGVTNLEIYDHDGVSSWNIPNQFYRHKDAKEDRFKAEALADILDDFTDADDVVTHTEQYVNQPLGYVVIVCTDSMKSRKLVWEQFKKQDQCMHLIECRMGGEYGVVYKVDKRNAQHMSDYEETLYDDTKVDEDKCTEKSIIYNVLMISSMVCRAFKSIVTLDDKYPFEASFDMTNMIYMDSRNL